MTRPTGRSRQAEGKGRTSPYLDVPTEAAVGNAFAEFPGAELEASSLTLEQYEALVRAFGRDRVRVANIHKRRRVQ